MESPVEMKTPASGRRLPGAKWKLILALVGIVALAGAIKYLRLQNLLEQALDWVQGLGVWAPLIFVGLYALASVCLVPGSVLTLGAGAVFGVVWGSVYASVGATLGATAAFLVGRYLARDWVARQIDRKPAFAALDKAIAEDGWKIVGLTRLSPVFPFVLLNYAFGLTRVSLRDYVLASWIGMMPGTLMYVYLGSLAQVIGQRERPPAEWALYGIGLVATIAVTVLVTRLAKRALGKRISTSNEQLEPRNTRNTRKENPLHGQVPSPRR
jgi:uncharacterized membrane protein YdjX (TVP38/TMEM64 family)